MIGQKWRFTWGHICLLSTVWRSHPVTCEHVPAELSAQTPVWAPFLSCVALFDPYNPLFCALYMKLTNQEELQLQWDKVPYIWWLSHHRMLKLITPKIRQALRNTRLLHTGVTQKYGVSNWLNLTFIVLIYFHPLRQNDRKSMHWCCILISRRL